MDLTDLSSTVQNHRPAHTLQTAKNIKAIKERKKQQKRRGGTRTNCKSMSARGVFLSLLVMAQSRSSEYNVRMIHTGELTDTLILLHVKTNHWAVKRLGGPVAKHC